MLVGRVAKETTDRSRVLVDFNDRWLDPTEVVAGVTTPVVSPPVGTADATPLVVETPTLIDGASQVQLMLTAGTPGVEYLVSFVATGSVSAREQTIELAVTVAPAPVVSPATGVPGYSPIPGPPGPPGADSTVPGPPGADGATGPAGTYVAGNGIAINAGTISADTQASINATATGVITPTAGMQSCIVNMGTVDTVLSVAPGYQGQHLRLEIRQGATPHLVALDATFVFSTDITSFTATAAGSKRDLMQLICLDGTHWGVAAVNKGFSV